MDDSFFLRQIPAISGSLKLDHDACANIGAILTPCHGEMRELKGEHHHKVVEISENAGKCLEEEYLVSSQRKSNRLLGNACAPGTDKIAAVP